MIFRFFGSDSQYNTFDFTTPNRQNVKHIDTYYRHIYKNKTKVSQMVPYPQKVEFIWYILSFSLGKKMAITYFNSKATSEVMFCNLKGIGLNFGSVI